MNAHRRAIAHEVFSAGREHDARQSDRLDRLRNVEPETAELLGVLVRATGARRVLEIGSSTGYSTLWLADAVEATGGRLETLELDPRRTAQARTTCGAPAWRSSAIAAPSAPPRPSATTTPAPGSSYSSMPSGRSTPLTGRPCDA